MNLLYINLYNLYWSFVNSSFTSSGSVTGNRGEWASNVESKWKNCLVFGNIIEIDGSITKCIWAGNKDYIYETGAVYWDEPEFEGSERPPRINL